MHSNAANAVSTRFRLTFPQLSRALSLLLLLSQSDFQYRSSAALERCARSAFIPVCLALRRCSRRCSMHSSFDSSLFPLLCLAFYILQVMTEQLVHDEYMALHDRVDDAGADFEIIRCGTVEQRAEWEARRACWRWGRYPRPGTAETTKEALKVAHGQTLLCRVPACRSLVDLQSARRIARAAGRSRFEPGDGCGSRCCSRKHWKARFHAQQLKMASALRDGSRVLVLWPPTIKGRVELKVAPADLADAAAETVAPVD